MEFIHFNAILGQCYIDDRRLQAPNQGDDVENDLSCQPLV